MPGPDMTRPLTIERLKEVVSYDATTGVFTWLVKQAKNTRLGGPAGGLRNGTHYIRIDKTDYTAARLAWFYSTGEWPHRIKFVDGNKNNVRLSNIEQTHALPDKYDHSTPDGRTQYLRDHYRAHTGARRDSTLRNKFGISLERYNEMHAAQDCLCAICGKPETGLRNGKQITLAVDHNHDTGAVRELLCRGCNQMIGNAYESITTLQAAIDYLKRHSDDAPLPFSPYHADLGMALN